MIRSQAVGLLVTSLLILQPSPSEAQGRGQGLQLSREEMLQVIQQRFQARLTRELQLNEEQQEVMGEIFGTFARARAEILPRRRELQREVRQLLMSGGQSEEQALELIDGLRELRQQEADLLAQEEERLLEVLSPTQVLRFQIMRDQFGQQIRQLTSPNNRRNGAPGPGGAGGFGR